MKDEIISLQSVMKTEGIDIYYIPSNDFHGSEYVGEFFQARKYLSGFTGSAGTLIVTKTSALLWTDGRYFTQAEQELHNTGIQLMKIGEDNIPSIEEWLENNIYTNMTFAFDGRCMDGLNGEKYDKIVTSKGGQLRYDLDLVDRIWHNRPSLSKERIWKLDEKHSGQSLADKLVLIKAALPKDDLSNNTLILCALDDIAWTLNLRGNDILYCPLFLSYLVINDTSCTLYVDEDKLTLDIIHYLSDNNISIRPYLSIYEDINNFSGNVYTDYSSTNYALIQTAKNVAAINIISFESPVTILKAVKNPIECANIRKAHIKDGIALVKFMKWLEDNISNVSLKSNIAQTPLTEITVAEKLEEFRSQQEGYVEPSFEPIMGYKEHGAIIHYAATPESAFTLANEGFLLSDTGAHYREGSTDVTRTFVLGPISDEMKYHYTLVLKGHLNLLSSIFKEGCSGLNLDYIARKPIWEAGLDYNHGTGHGVGYLLNVHEGPQAIRHRITPGRNESIAFKPGMVTSNEPGLYFPGKYGIRLENLILCVEKMHNEYGTFLGFEPLTLCPFEANAINASQLTNAELSTLNEYHNLVYKTLKPYLTEEEKLWLKCVTAPLEP